MIKQIFLIFWIGFFASVSISEVRELYKNCSISKEKALHFYQKLANVEKNDKNIVLSSYKAAAITLKSKYEKGLKRKKQLFKEGALLLEENIKKEPNNIELRLIRLSIQENVPKILRYKKNITEDKHFIYKNLHQVKNKKLRNYIKTFVLQSKSFTKEEKNVLSQL